MPTLSPCIEAPAKCLGSALHSYPSSNHSSANLSFHDMMRRMISLNHRCMFLYIILNFYLCFAAAQTQDPQDPSADSEGSDVDLNPSTTAFPFGVCWCKTWNMTAPLSSSQIFGPPKPASILSQEQQNGKGYFHSERNASRGEALNAPSSTAAFIPILPRDATMRLQARESTPPPADDARSPILLRQPFSSRLQVQDDAPRW